jgi:DHA2 family multidrug resistance protein-like MFS transporter
VAVSAELPASLATDLLEAARDAFTLGLQAAALASAIVAAATAAVTILFLRRVRAGAVGESASELNDGRGHVPAAELE